MIIKRGICPECGGEFQLTKAGVMRDHRGDIYVGGWRQQCHGVGEPPSALAADPIAAAEDRGGDQAVTDDDLRFVATAGGDPNAYTREGICGDESRSHPFNCSGTLPAICHLRFGHGSRWHESETGQRWKYHDDDPARDLIRKVLLYGTGFRWRRADGEVLTLDPAEVDMFVAADIPETMAEAESRGRSAGYAEAVQALRDQAHSWLEGAKPRTFWLNAAAYLEHRAAARADRKGDET